MTVRRVLLVCSGNTCRSPMASALLRKLWQAEGTGEGLEVTSAGTGAFPGMEATDHAVAAMKRRGLDLTPHRSATVTDQTLSGMDLILTMTSRHKEYILMLWPELRAKVYTLGEYAGTGGEVPDPFGGSLAEYESTAAELERVLRKVVTRLRTERGSDE